MYRILTGDKAYSSWSLRGWLLLAAFGLPFEDVPVRMYDPEFDAMQAAKGIKLNKAQAHAAKELRALYDDLGQAGQEAGVLGTLKDDYVNQLWRRMGENRDDVVNIQTLFGKLLEHFDATIHISQRANSIRSTTRDEIWSAAALAYLGGNHFQFSIEVRTSGVFTQVGAENSIEKHVSRAGVRFAGVCDAVLKHHFTGHAEFARCRGSLPYMIRLNRADRNDRIRPLCHRLTHGEFKFSRLVSAGREACTVITLDVDVGASQMLAQAWHVFEGRGQMRQFDAWKIRQLHILFLAQCQGDRFLCQHVR